MTQPAAAILAVLAASVIWWPGGEATARPASAPSVTFTRWVMEVSHNGSEVRDHVSPSGTVRICQSDKLTQLQAHYHSSGLADDAGVHVKLQVTGQSPITERGRVFSRGYFYVASGQHGLPEGTWSLKVIRHRRVLGSSSVTASQKHC